MCDSITILVLLQDQSQAVYDRCQYPKRGKEDTDETSSDFRAQYPLSPLTGAGFKITAVGLKIRSDDDAGPIEGNRKNYGRVAGYLVDFNPPACTVGHNRVLVNGVPAAAKVGLALLKHWLASNGCKPEGLDALQLSGVRIISATPTFLFDFFDENAARLVLANFRVRSEALCNTKKKDRQVRPPAFSVPPRPDPNPRSRTYIYTSYVKMREYLIDCYVKSPEVGKKFKVLDRCPDYALDPIARRTLRIGVKLHGKWLREHELDKVENWAGRDEPYKQAFGLVREVLQLDKDFRNKQLRAPTVGKLNLSKTDKTLLRYHLARNNVREHPMFLSMTKNQANKAYSASRIRVLAATGVPFQVDYSDHVKVFSPPLGKQLTYPGEYKPPQALESFVFSRLSVPVSLAKLAELTELVLEEESGTSTASDSGRDSRREPELPSGPQTHAPLQRRYARGISQVPVEPDGG